MPNECRPPGRHCLWCGATVRLIVAHVDGNGSNGSPTPRPDLPKLQRQGCARHEASGFGRRTRQYNPHGGQGAQTLAQWMAAVMSMKGESDQMNVSDVVGMIHDTPASDRSRFARQRFGD